MFTFFKKRLLVILSASILLLAGCFNQQSPEEKMFDKLEKVVSAEKNFEAQQDPLVSLEKKEKEIYAKIISLGMKEFDEIVKLSDEALKIAGERKEHIDKEQESMKASEKEFNDVPGLIEKIEKSELKKLGNDLYDTMQQRYKAHDELYSHYVQGLELDKELYEMFKQKELSLDELEQQITKVNETYEKVLETNDQFNELTEKYNKEKLEFYKEAGLDVTEQESK